MPAFSPLAGGMADIDGRRLVPRSWSELRRSEGALDQMAGRSVAKLVGQIHRVFPEFGRTEVWAADCSLLCRRYPKLDPTSPPLVRRHRIRSLDRGAPSSFLGCHAGKIPTGPCERPDRAGARVVLNSEDAVSLSEPIAEGGRLEYAGHVARARDGFESNQAALVARSCLTIR